MSTDQPATRSRRFASRDGVIVVDTVRLVCAGARDGDWLRVMRHGYFAGEIRADIAGGMLSPQTVADLADLGVDLADLAEIPAEPRRSPSRAARAATG